MAFRTISIKRNHLSHFVDALLRKIYKTLIILFNPVFIPVKNLGAHFMCVCVVLDKGITNKPCSK